MSLTTDKMRSLVRKWCTLIQAIKEVKTSDGFFAAGFCDWVHQEATKPSQEELPRKELSGEKNQICSPA